MTMTRTVLVADIGKSTTRTAVWRDGLLAETVTGPGIEGLAAPDGVGQAMARMQELAPQLRIDAADAVAIGVAGALSAPDAAAGLAEMIAGQWRTPACVTSDVIIAHLGALGGEAGTILVAGTGAVAFGVFADGTSRVADGLGPEIGDHGGGYWIGRAGMRAALRAGDRPGAETEITSRWSEMTAYSHPIAWLSPQG